MASDPSSFKASSIASSTPFSLPHLFPASHLSPAFLLRLQQSHSAGPISTPPKPAIKIFDLRTFAKSLWSCKPLTYRFLGKELRCLREQAGAFPPIATTLESSLPWVGLSHGRQYLILLLHSKPRSPGSVSYARHLAGGRTGVISRVRGLPLASMNLREAHL